MSRKISVMDHLAFVTGPMDLLVVELLSCVIYVNKVGLL